MIQKGQFESEIHEGLKVYLMPKHCMVEYYEEEILQHLKVTVEFPQSCEKGVVLHPHLTTLLHYVVANVEGLFSWDKAVCLLWLFAFQQQVRRLRFVMHCQ